MSDNKTSKFEPRFPIMRARGNPVPIPDAFSVSISRIVIEWSRFEQGLASDTSTMMNYAVVSKLATEAPRSFIKKVELWKRAVNKLYVIPEYIHFADDISMRAKEVAKFRNHLVHGIWDLNGPNDQGGWRVINVHALKTVEKHDTLIVTQGLLDQLHQEIQDLSDDIFGFIATKVLHQHKGLLTALHVSSDEHLARPNPPIDAKS